MAVRYAVASGNWSSVSTWDGGASVPTTGDDVYVENKVITIDITTITVANIYNTLRSGGTLLGGNITVSINNVTITANLIATGPYLLYSTIITGRTLNIIGNISHTLGSVGNGYTCVAHNGLGTLNITGNVTGCTTYGCNGLQNGLGATVNILGNLIGGNGSGAHAVLNSSTGIINATGNMTGGGTAGSAGVANASTGSVNITGICIAGAAYAVLNTSTGPITINGNQTAVGNSLVYLIQNSSTGVININGDCLGALSSAPSTAYIVNNAGTGIININGSVTARNVSPSTTIGIVNNGSTGTINISANVSGGTVANTIGVSNASTGIINVTGNVTGGSNATNTPAIYMTAAGTIQVNGIVTSNSYPAIFSTVITAIFKLLGNVTNVSGIPGYFGSFNIKISPTNAQTFTFQDTSNVNRLIATSNISPGAPGIADVRFGTIYGSSSEYTGTLRVPNPNTVSLGVLTDNTTGTMIMTPADFWGVASNGLTTAGSIGERLKNASTVQSNGDQLASYIV